ncbi:MAG: thiolase family protein [Actinobacteria bacterium]|nr:thiolase family protein [Actinomycetota bacterium]
MREAVIVAAVRTPIADAYKGALAHVSIHDLAKATVAEALKRSGVPADDVDDLVLGEVLHGGGDVARYVAVDLGLPPDIPGLAVNRQCATGMSALNVAAAEIMAGMNKVAIAGGAASMTQAPATYLKSPTPYGHMTQWLSPSHPDTPDAPNMNMLITVGENTADQCGITREDMDEWSFHSHRKAVAAIDAGRFDEEIVPVTVPAGRNETTLFTTDEHPRRDTTMERLASLRGLTAQGRVTAGNSSPLNDGSAALVLCSDDYAVAHGLTPLAKVRSWAAAGVPPKETGIAPTIAIPRALERAGLTTSDVDVVEINEAFASMAVACTRVLGFDPEIVNVNGGAVALGHPVACSGARILVTMIHELRRRGGGIGVGSLCAGGGMGAATVLEVLPG